MAAQYTLPAWVDKLSIEDAVKLLLIGFFGQAAPSGGGSGGITSQPATYNVSAQGSTSVTISNTALSAATTTARKIDIINTGANGVWVARGATAALNTGYYLAQYGVLSVDEPTTDAFNAISTSGTMAVYRVERTAA